jgi:hypothetical protein
MNSGIFSKASVWFLIAANLFPLVGVFLWGWDLFFLMVLYWSESAIVGFFGIVSIIFETRILSVLLVPFFCFHFGMFMMIHFVFITLLFGPPWARALNLNESEILSRLYWEQGLWVPVLFLFVSHAASFFLNRLKLLNGGQKEPDNTIPEQTTAQLPAPAANFVRKFVRVPHKDMMAAPYRRVVVMHLTIIFGAILAMIFRSNKAAFVLMILLKIVADLRSHVRVHKLADGSLVLEQKSEENQELEKNGKG